MPSRWLTLNEAFEAAQKSTGGCRQEEFLQFLRRGEIKSKAEVLTTWRRRQGQLTAVSGKGEIERLAPIETDFWRMADVDFSTSTATEKTKAGDDAVVAEGVLVRRVDVERLWPIVLAGTDKQETSGKHKGGAPRKWDWEGAIMEMGRIAHDEGLPEKQAEFVKRIQDWFYKEKQDNPADSEVKNAHSGDRDHSFRRIATSYSDRSRPVGADA